MHFRYKKDKKEKKNEKERKQVACAKVKKKQPEDKKGITPLASK